MLGGVRALGLLVECSDLFISDPSLTPNKFGIPDMTWAAIHR